MIKIRDLTFEYFDRDKEGNLTEMINAIRGISFDAKPGEFLVIAGENGSGKSTFAKILNRLLLPIEGTVEIDGLDAMQEENILPIRKRVGMVFQNPDDQLIGSVVEEDVAFGAENIGVPAGELAQRVKTALTQVGLDGRLRISDLSGGEKQKTAIAGVLAMEPGTVILDEATAMLDPVSRFEIWQILKKLQKEGITVILITHLTEELLLADRIYVMHRGKLCMKGSRMAVLQDADRLAGYGLRQPVTVQIAQALFARGCISNRDFFSLEDIADRIYREHPCAFLKEKTMEPLSQERQAHSLTQAILFQGVSLSNGKKKILRDVTFSIEKGSYTAIIGPSGAGKSTIMQMIPALVRPDEGSIFVDGMEVTDAAVNLRALRTKIGYVFQNPEEQLFAKNIYEDVVFGPRNIGIREVEAEKRAYEAIELVGLSQDVYDLPAEQLSGGQRRRAALAGVLAMQPEYLILDEPLAGLDPVGSDRMLALMDALHRDAGITIVTVSHDADALCGYADRVIRVEDGCVTEEGEPEEVFYRLWLKRMEHAAPDTLSKTLCDLPVCMQLLIRLRLLGLPVTCRHTGVEETTEEIVRALNLRA